MWQGLSRIILHLLALWVPFIVIIFFQFHSDHALLSEIAKNFALLGFVVLILQPVLAGRFKWIERPFGLDILFRYHKYMGVFVACLLLLHPLLLVAAGGGLRLLFSLDVPWYIWVGKATLFLLLVNIGLSLYQSKLHLKFEKWRLTHDGLGVLIIVLAFTHSWFAGHDLEILPIKLLWVIALGAAVVTFVYHRIIRPLRLRRHSYSVADVQAETKNVWTVKLSPPEGEKKYDFLPGQFHFLTFHRDRNLPEEEHHWTISSSPTQKGYISSTIKELGDFTSTIGQTRPGDTATVHGPFGRFSYLLHPEEKDLVFISGGIGITPLMSMLRHMRDTQSTLPVLLLYASKNEEEVVFRKELNEIEAGGFPRLKLVLILSKPEKDWTGEKGYIDRKKIERYTERRIEGKGFYICGPPGLVDLTLRILGEFGVPDERIHLEIFSFL